MSTSAPVSPGVSGLTADSGSLLLSASEVNDSRSKSVGDDKPSSPRPSSLVNEVMEAISDLGAKPSLIARPKPVGMRSKSERLPTKQQPSIPKKPSESPGATTNTNPFKPFVSKARSSGSVSPEGGASEPANTASMTRSTSSSSSKDSVGSGSVTSMKSPPITPNRPDKKLLDELAKPGSTSTPSTGSDGPIPQSVSERRKMLEGELTASMQHRKTRLTPSTTPTTRSLERNQEPPSNLEADVVDASIKKKRTESIGDTSLSSDEPPIKELPLEAAPLQHLNKARPRRAKTKAATRPVPAPAPTTDDAIEEEANESADMFYRAPAVSHTPVIVTPKSRTASVRSDVDDKTEKTEESPKVKPKLRSPFGNSAKEKVEADKKKQTSLASGITNFFSKKKKVSEKHTDQTDSTPVSTTESPPPTAAVPTKPQRPSRATPTPPTPQSRQSTNTPDIPEEKADGVAPEAAGRVTPNKSMSLERNADHMSESTSSKHEEQGAPVPAPKKRMPGVPIPGMSGGLLAEMKSKRTSMQPPAQPKAAPRVKSEEPKPLQPPATKPASEVKNKEEAAPPARPSPPKPSATPREDSPPTPPQSAKPAPPVLRPKPPKLMPKPKPTQRPQTMDVSHLNTTAKPEVKPPRPTPPNLAAKRQSLTSEAAAHPPGPTAPTIEVSTDKGKTDESNLKQSQSHGDIAILDEEQTSPVTSKDCTPDDMSNPVVKRNSSSKSISSSLRLSNGSLKKNTSATPDPNSARTEDGPVLRPPPRHRDSAKANTGKSQDSSNSKLSVSTTSSAELEEDELGGESLTT